MTDVEADIQAAIDVIGWPDSAFYTYWHDYVSGGLPWDGEECSEIACCISYFGGNLSKIAVSNYAAGLVDLFRAGVNGTSFGSVAMPGAFIWFTYGSGEPEHTGRVIDVSNGIITTVEGNIRNLDYVAQFTYPENSPLIYGYGYPNYDNQQIPTPPTPPTPGGNQGTYNRIRRRRHQIFY